MQLARVAIVAGCIGLAACAPAIVRPSLSPSKPSTEALLVLPGFGYGGKGEEAFRSLAKSAAADGIDVFVPTFVARSGLTDSRERLRRFIHDNRLERYNRVHVFAFIAGGWTFNPLAETDALPNLSTVLYDRSPYQERAPRLAQDKLRLLTWMKYGPVVFDLARTPYPALSRQGVKIGLLVETRPTSLLKRFASSARRYGPYHFECDAFTQRYDDCLYVDLSHDELYTRFAQIWPDVRSFMRTGQFTPSANRTPPVFEVLQAPATNQSPKDNRP